MIPLILPIKLYHYIRGEKKKMACETIKKLAIDGGIAVNTKPFPLWPEYSGKTYQMLANGETKW